MGQEQFHAIMPVICADSNLLHLFNMTEEVHPMSNNLTSDVMWYCRKDEERFYEIFFQLCQKYHVRWANASEKEKHFIEEVTRVRISFKRWASDHEPCAFQSYSYHRCI